MARHATPAEQQALSVSSLALAALTAQLVPGILTAVLAAVLAHYLILYTAALTLRLDPAQLLAGHHDTLRAITAGTLLTIAAALHAITTLTTHALTTTARHITPQPPAPRQP
ncbi:hypothetical protein ACWGB8_01910 [Kitasatospora sp. NPDC054939]